MPIYIGDYLADTMHLNTTEHGAYLLLIFAYWRTGKPLADDDRLLAGICKASAKQWRDLRPTLSRFFSVGEGEWRHKRIEAELVSASDGYAKRRAAAMQRWSKADALHEQPHPQPHSSLRDDKPPVGPHDGKSKRGSRLPAGWQPDEQDREFAESLGLDAASTAASFRDYWLAKPSNATKLDWSATWRVWCRRSAERPGGSSGGQRLPNRQGPNSLIAAARAVAAQIEGER